MSRINDEHLFNRLFLEGVAGGHDLAIVIESRELCDDLASYESLDVRREAMRSC